MIDESLKGTMKTYGAVCLIGIAAFALIDWRISAGIAEGYLAMRIYGGMLSAHAAEVMETKVPRRRAYARIAVLAAGLLLPFLFPEILDWRGTFGSMLAFRIVLLWQGARE